ncbi:hypothetical protein J41TS4_25240 [Paenibacillus apis]|uniref:Uncharacterized protein n=1 Tax=Paenibacillus apis TaxID=1792174 RepID=A0A919Y279_9BACL|nr:hypothetical protein J41TS4_25240 [Paenibacillus apis]
MSIRPRRDLYKDPEIRMQFITRLETSFFTICNVKLIIKYKQRMNNENKSCVFYPIIDFIGFHWQYGLLQHKL